MSEYNVEIIETLSKVVTVNASSPDMARRIVEDMYRDEDIVLDYGDFDKVEFKTEY